MADTIVIETPVATVLEVSGKQGPQGIPGATGATGATGPQGPAGTGIETLTTKGDLLSRDDSAAIRVGIGSTGQILKVSAQGLPSWANESGAVSSVNNQTGAVVLTSADVGAAEASHQHQPSEVFCDAAFVFDSTFSAGEPNGVYLRDGSDNGKAIYKSAQGYAIFWDSEQEEWVLGNTTQSQKYFVGTGDTTYPWEASNWVVGPNGGGDTPGIEQASLNQIQLNLASDSVSTRTPKTGNASSTQVVLGNDTRLTSAVPTSRTISAGTGLTGGGDLSANRTLSISFGSSAGSVCEGNDARLSDARTPSSTLAHAASHATGGSDPLAPSDIGAMPQFSATDQTLTAASTTLTAGRARRLTLTTVHSGTTEVVLPTTSNQNADLFQLIRGGAGANQTINVTASAGGSTLASLGGTADAGRSFTFRYQIGPNSWFIVPVDAHSADKIISGTLAHERGGLEADVSAYSGLVKISGGSTSAVTVTAAGEALLDDATNADQRTTLGLGTAAVANLGTGASDAAYGNHAHAQLHDRSHAITSTSDHTAGNHKVFYSNGSGEIVELALGNSGEVLTSNGATSAPSFAAASGGDTVSIDASAADILSATSGAISADDAGSDKIVFWDDSASALKYLEVSTGLSISGTTLTATGGGGGSKTYAVFSAEHNQPPSTAFATLDTRNSIAVLDFDDATDESAVFVGIIPEGASLGSGLKIRLHWAATSATSGNCVWDVSLERMTTDLDSDSFDTIASATAAANGTSGILTVTEITLTTIDSVTAGDGFRLKVTRDANNGSDTMSGDAELVVCEVRSAA